jgi:hypothetical protein
MAMVLATVGLWFHTDFPVARCLLLALLVALFLIARAIRKRHEKTTEGDANLQLLQIQTALGTKLPGIQCPEAWCPAR